MLRVPERNGAPSALGVLLSGVPVQSVPWILGTCTFTIRDPKGCLRQPSLLPLVHVGLYLLLSPATTLFLVPLWYLPFVIFSVVGSWPAEAAQDHGSRQNQISALVCKKIYMDMYDKQILSLIVEASHMNLLRQLGS